MCFIVQTWLVSAVKAGLNLPLGTWWYSGLDINPNTENTIQYDYSIILNDTYVLPFLKDMTVTTITLLGGFLLRLYVCIVNPLCISCEISHHLYIEQDYI